MKFTKIISDGNGGYNLFDDWTTGQDSIMKIFPMLIMLPIILLFSLFLPAVFWLIAPVNTLRNNHKYAYYGIAVSLLFFLDYWFGGLLWTVFHTSELEAGLYFFGGLHIVFILINIIRLSVYNSGGELPLIIPFIMVAVSMYFGYDMLTSIAEGMSASTPCFWTEEWYNKEMLELIPIN